MPFASCGGDASTAAILAASVVGRSATAASRLKKTHAKALLSRALFGEPARGGHGSRDRSTAHRLAGVDDQHRSEGLRARGVARDDSQPLDVLRRSH